MKRMTNLSLLSRLLSQPVQYRSLILIHCTCSSPRNNEPRQVLNCSCRKRCHHQKECLFGECSCSVKDLCNRENQDKGMQFCHSNVLCIPCSRNWSHLAPRKSCCCSHKATQLVVVCWCYWAPHGMAGHKLHHMKQVASIRLLQVLALRKLIIKLKCHQKIHPTCYTRTTSSWKEHCHQHKMGLIHFYPLLPLLLWLSVCFLFSTLSNIAHARKLQHCCKQVTSMLDTSLVQDWVRG